MSRLRDRFRAVVQRLGEDYVASGSTRRGVLAVLSATEAETYLTPTELGATGRPSRVAYVRDDDPTSAGTSTTWGSLSLLVKRAINARVRGETVARVLILE